MTSQIKTMLNQQRDLMIQQRNMYLAVAEELNSKYLDVLKANRNGDGLLKAVTYDVAGQLSTTYLGLNDLNISADQIVRRTLNFSYDNEFDPLKDEFATKDPLNAMSENDFNEISQGEAYYMNHSNKEFGSSAERDQYGQKRARKLSDGTDTLTGEQDSRLEADHVLARASIRTPNWLGQEGREAIRENNESQDNFQMINWKVNRVKSDNQVWKNPVTGEIIGNSYRESMPEGYVNITDIASPRELNQAFVSGQERAYQKAQQTINNPNVDRDSKEYRAAELTKTELERSVIDPKTGKVLENVSNNNLANVKRQINKNDRILVQGFVKPSALHQNFKTAGSQTLKGRAVYDKDGNDTGKRKGGLKDLLTGQLVYYALPPLVFEVKEFFSKQKKGYDGIIKRLGRSVSRITKYVFGKLKDIFKNVVSALSRNFVRNFLNLLIEVLKGALKGLFKILRDFTMSIVSSIKVLANKDMQPIEKASAITNLMTTTLISVGVQALFELIPKGIPEWITMPVQIIVTAILSALAMRFLEEHDIFNIQRGIKLAKLRQVFDEQATQFEQNSENISAAGAEITQRIVDDLAAVKNQTMTLTGVNYYSDDVWPTLQAINDTFDMGIDFDEEWAFFANA